MISETGGKFTPDQLSTPTIQDGMPLGIFPVTQGIASIREHPDIPQIDSWRDNPEFSRETDDTQVKIASFKDLVDVGLQEYFGRNSRYAEYAGLLSVHPERVAETVTSETLEHQCDDFSREFQRIESDSGLMTQLAVSDQGYDEHVYLVPDESHGLPDVIIDLTLGQYVRGHNHAFVGTRAELRDIVVHQTGEGKPYMLEEPSELLEPEEIALYMEPIVFFQRKWGETSVIV